MKVYTVIINDKGYLYNDDNMHGYDDDFEPVLGIYSKREDAEIAIIDRLLDEVDDFCEYRNITAWDQYRRVHKIVPVDTTFVERDTCRQFWYRYTRRYQNIDFGRFDIYYVEKEIKES